MMGGFLWGGFAWGDCYKWWRRRLHSLWRIAMHCMEEKLMVPLERWRDGWWVMNIHMMWWVSVALGARASAGRRWISLDYDWWLMDTFSYIYDDEEKTLRATLLYEFTILSTYSSSMWMYVWMKLHCLIMCLKSSWNDDMGWFYLCMMCRGKCGMVAAVFR